MAHDAEYLAVSAGKMEGKPTVILTFRPNREQSWSSSNLALSRDQAFRLMGDLKFLFDNSTTLKTVEPDEPAPEPETEPDRPRRRRRKRGDDKAN
jgi:hypothetical protein